jgi:hypothetical protein
MEWNDDSNVLMLEDRMVSDTVWVLFYHLDQSTIQYYQHDLLLEQSLVIPIIWCLTTSIIVQNEL